MKDKKRFCVMVIGPVIIVLLALAYILIPGKARAPLIDPVPTVTIIQQ
ncbi:MAG: hypothetical protein WCP97_06215 [bacterium]